MNKISGFLFILLLHQFSNAQTWKYPYTAVGEYQKKPSVYIHPLKCAVIDLKYLESPRIYQEYDKRGNMTLEASGIDSIYIIQYAYDDFDEQIYCVTYTGDTIYYQHKRDENNLLLETITIQENNKTVSKYIRNSKGNLTKSFYNEILSSEQFYDSLDRLHEVREYLHEKHTLSSIRTYHYHGENEISYDECPFDREGKRYNWPCETTVGKLNNRQDLKKLTVTFYNGTDTANVSVSKYFYNSHHRLKKIIINEYDYRSVERFTYNKKGVMILWQNFKNKELIGEYSFEVLE